MKSCSCHGSVLHYSCLWLQACTRWPLIVFAATWGVSVLLTIYCMSISPSVITLGEPKMNSGFLYEVGKASKVIQDNVS